MSFYMRTLPETCISLTSEEGMKLLEEAHADGMAVGFITLLGCLEGQAELTFCGISTLITVLNALRIDPNNTWKGPFRWYDPSMLVGEQALDKIRSEGVTFEELGDIIPKDKVQVEAYLASDTSFDRFQGAICDVCSSDTRSMLVSYSRRLLQQTGDGHFSPIGAYHIRREMVLVVDVARYKYPPHWVTSTDMWNAMKETDSVSGKTRGFMTITKLASS